MKSNAETAKHILSKRAKPNQGDEKSTDTKDGGTATDNAEPDGLAQNMEDIGKHLANKDWQGAADAFRRAHTIASATRGDNGKDDLTSGNEY